MTEHFRFESYGWRDLHQTMLVRGASDGPQVIIMPPLFEEMNFLRMFLADFGRELATEGIATWLPDLPGAGDSLAALETMEWQDWRDAVRSAADTVAMSAGKRPHVAAFRGGALLADAADGVSLWQFAPSAGAPLLRHLQRAERIGGGGQPADGGAPRDLAGYRLAAPLHRAIANAIVPAPPIPTRTFSGMGDATPLWRRAEPARDPALAAAAATDITEWIARCEGR